MLSLTVVLTSGLVAIVQAPTPATAAPTQTSVPLIEFANDGVGGRAWNSYNQTINSAGPSIAGRPSPIGYGDTVHVYARATNGDLMEYINDDAGHRLWNSYNLTQITQGPTLAADPDATFYGTSVHVYGEAPNGDLMEYVNDDAGGRLWNSYDLTQAAGGPTLGGDPTPLVSGSSDWVFARASNGDLVEFTNDGANGQLWNAYDLTQGSAGPAINNDPNPVLVGSVLHVYAESSSGAMTEFTDDHLNGQTWNAYNLTAMTGGPTVTGRPSPVVLNGVIQVYARSHSGVLTEFASDGANGHLWNTYPVGTPTVVGDPSAILKGSTTYVYAQATGGDLTEFIGGGNTWSNDDPTQIAGGPAIGGDPGALLYGGVSIHVYAGGLTQTSPPGGVGVYGLVPGAQTTQAIKDNWPIIGDTGALGTQTSPYTGLSIGGDLETGLDITASGRRVTWLSFWTVSGPVDSGPSDTACYTTSCYFSDGYAAGQYVATTIDSYKSQGVSVKPDWVILDPEGYPDNHSGLDDPTVGGTSSNWLSFLTGWSQGITSIDPNLHPGFYADQTEYNDFDLSAIQLPAFVAIAFPSPSNILNSTSNVAGYVAFGATCPSSTEEQTLVSSPWNGSYNTLQFSGATYCAP
jgi:hypothetical protein